MKSTIIKTFIVSCEPKVENDLQDDLALAEMGF